MESVSPEKVFLTISFIFYHNVFDISKEVNKCFFSLHLIREVTFLSRNTFDDDGWFGLKLAKNSELT